MNKIELQRRLATIAPATLEKAVALVRAGYGNLTLECDVNVKQSNAVHQHVRDLLRAEAEARAAERG